MGAAERVAGMIPGSRVLVDAERAATGEPVRLTGTVVRMVSPRWCVVALDAGPVWECRRDRLRAVPA